jgi:aspartate/methionine/tyrosine aminotransferase
VVLLGKTLSPVPPKTARRAESLAQSEIRRMTRECERVGGINLGQGICDLPHLSPVVLPEGAYYVLADLSRTSFEHAPDASLALLERTKVASLAGTAFFDSTAGDRFLRFCFAKEDDVLAEACSRIRAVRL